MNDPLVLPHLLSRSATSFPDRIAAVSGENRLTYSALASISDKLASTLITNGIRRGDRVGIYVPLSLASLISPFAIMKAGATYVPLDPSSPAKRLGYVVQNCGIRALLSNSLKIESAKTFLAEETPPRLVVLVDVDIPEDGRSSTPAIPQGVRCISWNDVLKQASNHQIGALPMKTDTAYILYTSGSTGAPKGVTISHQNSMAFVNWAHNCVGLTKEDRVVCHSPLHFDLSVFSIFSSCAAGAEVVIPSEGASVFPTQLCELIEKNRLTIWYSVPSALTLMVLYGDMAAYDLSSLRAIVFAGEVFPVKYLRELMARVPGARYFNWFGPTETNVCTSYEVPILDSGRTSPIPIGKPVAGLEVFALTDSGERVTKPGTSGELYVRGPSVMQGYWGDSQKTSGVIIRSPLKEHSDGLIYKTGDIVSLDEDGNFLYHGRKDGMIKTRGYRVEAGEIEAALYAHPSVKEAAVLGVPDEIFGSRIRAVVALRDGIGLSRDQLLAYCRQTLPSYMVPDIVEFWETLPKTSTGKVDRTGIAGERPRS